LRANPFAWRLRSRLHLPPCYVIEKSRDDSARSTRKHEFSDRFHRLYACAKHTSRGGPDRPALQTLPRKRLARARSCCSRALWRARPILKRCCPKVSQEMLAEMIGTTRPQVNFFMKQIQENWASSNTNGRDPYQRFPPKCCPPRVSTNFFAVCRKSGILPDHCC